MRVASKVVLVGQAPGRNGDPKTPLFGGRGTGKKLADLFGMDRKKYEDSFKRMNVLDAWPGRAGKGDRFPIRDARAAAKQKLRALRGRTVVFVGIGTAAVFGFDPGRPLKWAGFNGGVAAVLPHPSGVNRWWNDQANGRKTRSFAWVLMKKIREGQG
jgi:uracil-DNA glycosylase